MSLHSLDQQNSNTDSAQKASDNLLDNSSLIQQLHEATLHAMGVVGAKCTREILLHGLPTSEHHSIEGMMRAIRSTDLLAARKITLKDLDATSLPCIAALKGDVSGWGVIEAYDKSSGKYRVRCYGSTGEVPVREWAQVELEDGLDASLLSVFTKTLSQDNPAAERNSGFSSWMWMELKGLRSTYRDIIAATLLINLFAVAGPLFVMNVYDRVVPNLAMETLWVLASGLALVIVFELTTKLLRHLFLEQAGRRLDLVLSSKVFSRVMNIKVEAFPSSVGSLASQIKEFDSIKQFFTAATLTTVADVPFTVIFLFVISLVGGSVVFVPLSIALLMLAYGYLMHFPIKKLVDEMQVAAAEKNSVLVESISAIETIKSLNAQGRQQGLWEDALIRFSHFAEKAKHKTDSVGIVSAALMQLSTLLIVIVGVYQIEQQALSLGALIACVLLSSRALAPMAQVANLVAQYQQARSAYKGLCGLTELSSENRSADTLLSLGGGISSVEARDLSFSYQSGSRVLKDMSFSLSKGEKVAIIGKIGSGKSSLLRLLQGFGQADSGQLLVNGCDVKHLDLNELRASIAYVPQEIDLFKGSLRENILVKSPSLSQAELSKVVELSGLTEVVQSHEMGLDMPIGEHGKGLSGGQRQCVAIARALVSQPDLLLFDELSSSMDNQTEQLIVSNIRKIAEDKILLLSTHRASLLALVDRIIVMDQGKIVADGPKATVLDAMKRGLIQAGAKESDRKSAEKEESRNA